MSQSLTYHRDLRTGRTIWMARRRLPIPVARLTKNARCDVVVIGAGISGAIIAENLTDAGLYQGALISTHVPIGAFRWT